MGAGFGARIAGGHRHPHGGRLQQDNERDVCRRVIQYIAYTSGQTFTEPVWCDEDEERRIEAVFESPRQGYAIEHTRVEAFPGQIQNDEHFLDLLGPLDRAFPELGSLYRLSVPLTATVGLRRCDFEAIRRAVVGWVLGAAQKLLPGQEVRTRPPGVPFEVRLQRDEFSAAKGLRLSRWIEADYDLEPDRAARIASAMARKCPKLARVARRESRRSILVLESNDLPLSNAVVVARAAVQTLTGRDDEPDEVYLVETEGKPWALWIIKRGDERWPTVTGIPESGPIYLQVDDDESISREAGR